MKAGDYVRTEKYISKIINITNGETQMLIGFNAISVPKYKEYWLENGSMIFESEIIKASPNIIDLIEVGDIITFKEDDDVYKVICIPDKEVGLDIFYLAKNYDGETEDISISKEQMEKYIKSIVTKEQFSSMEYKVGD